MPQSIVSPETAHFPVIFFGELEAALTGMLCIFTVRFCNEATLFEQLRAVPLVCQVWSCLRTIFSFMTSIVHVEIQNLQTLFIFSGKEICNIIKGEQFVAEVQQRTVLSVEMTLRQRRASGSCCSKHVRGLLYSCHCTQHQMHCTHWLVSNAVWLTCGPQLKDTISRVSFLISPLITR